MDFTGIAKAAVRTFVPALLRPKAFRPALLREIVDTGRVLSGPFQGIAFPVDTNWTGGIPKLLGTYELELHPTLREWKKHRFPYIINVGSADGYYALGCANLWPSAKVIAYESDEAGRRILHEFACKNGVVDRIDVRGTCDSAELAKVTLATRKGLLLIDVEGGEDHLLTHETVGYVRDFHMIVELHDLRVTDLTDKLTDRLGATHQITEIWTRPRRFRDFTWPSNPLRKAYLIEQLRAISDEARGSPMRWFVFTPRSTGDAGH